MCFFLVMRTNDSDSDCTLGDTVCLALYKQKTDWSIHRQSQYKFHLSNLTSKMIASNVAVLTMAISESLRMRRFQSFLIPHVPTKKWQAKVLMKSLIFWKEFEHFTYRTVPYSYQLRWFENDYTHSGWSYLWHEMNSLPFTEVLSLCWTTSKILKSVLQSILGELSRPFRIEMGKYNWRIMNYERAILYASANFEEAKILRNLDNDVFGDDDLK